ncbi:MAG: NIL domain-containing protein [Planctomycetes bacterium]|nr:NIL domain-containing protein [Planctomycetota bacterium]
MAKAARKASRYRMTFPEVVLGEPIIYKLSHDFDVIPNIIRGRITDKSAHLEVEIVGSVKDTERALKFLSEKGVTIHKLD